MKIALQNVSKTFGGFKAVDAVSFEVGDAECFFLLGPSGCGKTTVLRIIAGFCAPDSGLICFDNDPVNNLAPHLRNTGLVFQNYALWPHLTVEENIAFGLTVPAHRVAKTERTERVRQMTVLLHLEGTEKRLPSQLSGGQQQRVALARALVVKPACLLLDEPLSNLDAKLRVEMRLEIKHIIKTLGITAVYVTHDQTEALSMADRCAIMRFGRIEQIGTPRELYERPRTRFIADFLGYTNLFEARVASRDSNSLRLATAAGEWVSEAPCGSLLRRSSSGYVGREPQGFLAKKGEAPCGKPQDIFAKPSEAENAIPPYGKSQCFPAKDGQAGSLPFKPGTAVVLAIRPEKARLGKWPADAPNVFTGIVKESIYLGAAVECRVELNCGLIINALQTDSCAALAERGKPISVMVDPRDVIVLPGK